MRAAVLPLLHLQLQLRLLNNLLLLLLPPWLHLCECWRHPREARAVRGATTWV
jgi:hypothetical protein